MYQMTISGESVTILYSVLRSIGLATNTDDVRPLFNTLVNGQGIGEAATHLTCKNPLTKSSTILDGWFHGVRFTSPDVTITIMPNREEHKSFWIDVQFLGTNARRALEMLMSMASVDNGTMVAPFFTSTKAEDGHEAMLVPIYESISQIACKLAVEGPKMSYKRRMIGRSWRA